MKHRLPLIEGSNRTRIEYHEDSKNFSAYFRVIQAHNGGIPTDPELGEYFRILFKWKEFIFHRCCSSSIQSILENGLIPGGKESRLSSTPLHLCGRDSDEEESSDDHATPQMHYHSHWKRNQDAVYWVKLAQAQGQGLQFWANNVTCDHRTRSCASRVHQQSDLSERRSNTVRQIFHPTTRAKSFTEKQLAIAAAATAPAMHL